MFRRTFLKGIVLLVCATTTTVNAANLLVNGNFDAGNAGFESDYVFGSSGNGVYSVGPDPSVLFSGAASFKDHTSGSGNLMVADASTDTNKIVWRETIAVSPAKTYRFTGWASSWGHFSGSDYDPSPSPIDIYVNDVKIGSGQASSRNGAWTRFTADWQSQGATSATVTLRIPSAEVVGNDPAFDDFSFEDISNSTPPCDAPGGLIAWWRAEDNFTDELGASNGLGFRGTTFAQGIAGRAFVFDGNDDVIHIPDGPQFQLDSFTISTWIYLNGYPTGANFAGWGMIFSRGDDRAGLDPIFLGMRPEGDVWFHVEGSEGGVDLAVNLPLLHWFQVVGTLDTSNGEMSFYTNGVRVASTATAIRPLKNLDPTIPGGVGIGNYGGAPTSNVNMPFNGLIDEVQLFSRPLTPEEIRAEYNFRTHPPDLQIQRVGNEVEISWDACGANWVLTHATTVPGQSWEIAPETPVSIGNRKRVLIDPSVSARYFRLKDNQ